MRRAMMSVAILAVVTMGCDRRPRYAPYPVQIDLLLYPTSSGGCAVVAVPQHAYARRDDALVWNIVNDACGGVDVKAITFDIPGVIDVEDRGDKKQRKGKVKPKAEYAKYKYTVELSNSFRHDPEVEIWP